jgi:tetratricopeptide (TPR) repeat protein
VFVVILPLSSPDRGGLEAQVAAAAREAGVVPIAPDDEEAGLDEATIQELARLEEEATHFELNLDLDQAAASRRQVVETLERHGATATQPGRLADALARLAAIEIQADRRDEAVRIWRRALALRTDLSLDSTFSPAAREAFDEARHQGGTLPPRPEREALDRICADRRVDAVLWIAVGYDEGDLTLVRVLHRPDSADQGEIRYNLGETDPGAELVLPAPLVTGLEQALASLGPEPTVVVQPEQPPPPPDDPPPPPPPDRCSPYYRCWWFYFTLGVVVVGAATATGLVVGLGEDQANVRVHFWGNE